MKYWYPVVCLILINSGCKVQQIIPTQDQTNVIKADLEYLASDELEGRATGSPGEQLAAEYIIGKFEQMGLSPKGDQAGFLQHFSKTLRANPHAETPSEDDEIISGKNVIAFDDNRAKNTIIIGAHYDHLGYGHEGSLFTGEPSIHNGADDNASGVAALMNLANYLSKLPDQKYNYLFIAFSGEERGLLGSNYFCKNPTIHLDEVNYMINMDMVGRLNKERQLAVYGTGTSPTWDSLFKKIKKPSFKYTFDPSGVGPSDHTSFYFKDIPVLHFFTGQHSDYHKPSDDAELINYDGIQDVISLIIQIVSETNKKDKLSFTKTAEDKGDSPRFKVTLGVVPDYLFDGKGMRIDGVRENKPAYRAELKAGDIVIKLGEREVADMMSYMKALSVFDPGDTTTVTVKRGDEEITKTITFEK